MIEAPIIGVVDLLNDHAVHAIAGKRHAYQPIAADGIKTGNALALVERYLHLGVRSIYIADLGAILDSEPHFDLLQSIAEVTTDLIIDAGASFDKLSSHFLGQPSIRFVIPSECYVNVVDWQQACCTLPKGKAILGLDLIGNRIRTSIDITFDSYSNKDTDDIGTTLIDQASPWIKCALAVGVETCLVLDLAYVGRCRGPGIAARCAALTAHWPTMKWISGGGVRHPDDVQSLLEAGCDGVLVATTLHRDETARPLFGLN